MLCEFFDILCLEELEGTKEGGKEKKGGWKEGGTEGGREGGKKRSCLTLFPLPDSFLSLCLVG